jgi:hypothetical protein
MAGDCINGNRKTGISNKSRRFMIGLNPYLQYTNDSGGLAELHEMLLFMVMAPLPPTGTTTFPGLALDTGTENYLMNMIHRMSCSRHGYKGPLMMNAWNWWLDDPSNAPDQKREEV